MTQVSMRKLDLRRKPLLRAAGCLPLALCLQGATLSLAQSRTNNTAASPLPYEVATVKPNKSGVGMYMMGWVSPDRYITSGTLDSLIKQAYEVQNNQVVGAPKWISSETYDVQAKIDPSLEGRLDFDHRMLQSRLILQSLLTDRFKLTLHRETKELPVYALVIAKNGLKMHQATPGDTYPNGIKDIYGKGHGMVIARRPGGIVGQGVPFALLVGELQHQQLGRTVVDQTGLTGVFDFRLQWTPDDMQAPPASQPGMGETASQDSYISFFTAIQEQIGLKLEPQKGPVDVLVIDHIERPSEN